MQPAVPAICAAGHRTYGGQPAAGVGRGEPSAHGPIGPLDALPDGRTVEAGSAAAAETDPLAAAPEGTAACTLCAKGHASVTGDENETAATTSGLCKRLPLGP